MLQYKSLRQYCQFILWRLLEVCKNEPMMYFLDDVVVIVVVYFYSSCYKRR